MKPRIAFKIIIDIAMTVALMLLMTYELIGQSTHEWIGMGMFVLFLIHHVLNRKWSGNLIKGKWTPFRIWQTILVLWVLVSMIGSMVSGIILSRSVFSFLPIRSGQSWARIMHLLCAYWGLVGMSLHLGLHWSMMMGMAKNHLGNSSPLRAWTLRLLAAEIAAYGVYAFMKRDIGCYMLLKSEFVFFDFEEPLAFFFVDYLAVMSLFVFLGHYITKGLKLCAKRKTI